MKTFINSLFDKKAWILEAALQDALQQKCFQKFCKIHRNATVSESLFNEVAGRVQFR